jgi:hypothetical protein
MILSVTSKNTAFQCSIKMAYNVDVGVIVRSSLLRRFHVSIKDL